MTMVKANVIIFRSERVIPAQPLPVLPVGEREATD